MCGHQALQVLSGTTSTNVAVDAFNFTRQCCSSAEIAIRNVVTFLLPPLPSPSYPSTHISSPLYRPPAFTAVPSSLHPVRHAVCAPLKHRCARFASPQCHPCAAQA
eukprot:3508549-Pleurochrysis_carterae.AAC.2